MAHPLPDATVSNTFDISQLLLLLQFPVILSAIASISNVAANLENLLCQLESYVIRNPAREWHELLEGANWHTDNFIFAGSIHPPVALWDEGGGV